MRILEESGHTQGLKKRVRRSLLQDQVGGLMPIRPYANRECWLLLCSESHISSRLILLVVHVKPRITPGRLVADSQKVVIIRLFPESSDADQPVLTAQAQPQIPTSTHPSPRSTITLLEPAPRTLSAKLLRFRPPVVRHQQCAIVLYQRLLQLILCIFIDVFLIVSDDRFGDSLANGVDLRGVSTASDSHADVDAGEFVETEDEEGFVDLAGFINRLYFKGQANLNLVP